jgi:hypothetical protein
VKKGDYKGLTYINKTALIITSSTHLNPLLLLISLPTIPDPCSRSLNPNSILSLGLSSSPTSSSLDEPTDFLVCFEKWGLISPIK